MVSGWCFVIRAFMKQARMVLRKDSLIYFASHEQEGMLLRG